jgi:ABC-type multidrug transport system fused ATPase/permease subunit
LKTRQSLDEIFPLLAVYAFSANRLIPAVQEIFHAVTQIRFGSKSLENLHRDLLGPLADTDEPPDAALSGSAGGTTALGCHSDIRFTGVTFQYPGVSVPALRNLSLVIPANTTCAFVGSTGAGKTTVVDLLLGLFPPTGGSILVDGVPLTADRMPAWRRGVGYVPQSIFLCDASITKNIAFGVPDELIDHAAVIEAARAADLDTFVGALREGYDTVVGERGVRLSGGQRQRIGIARALYHKPDVLILDEATSALDNVTEDVVMHAIHAMAGQRTIILIAHRLTTVRDCDRIFVLQHGILVDSGTHDELMVESTTFRALARA